MHTLKLLLLVLTFCFDEVSGFDWGLPSVSSILGINPLDLAQPLWDQLLPKLNTEHSGSGKVIGDFFSQIDIGPRLEHVLNGAGLKTVDGLLGMTSKVLGLVERQYTYALITVSIQVFGPMLAELFKALVTGFKALGGNMHDVYLLRKENEKLDDIADQYLLSFDPETPDKVRSRFRESALSRCADAECKHLVVYRAYLATTDSLQKRLRRPLLLSIVSPVNVFQVAYSNAKVIVEYMTAPLHYFGAVVKGMVTKLVNYFLMVTDIGFYALQGLWGFVRTAAALTGREFTRLYLEWQFPATREFLVSLYQCLWGDKLSLAPCWRGHLRTNYPSLRDEISKDGIVTTANPSPDFDVRMELSRINTVAYSTAMLEAHDTLYTCVAMAKSHALRALEKEGKSPSQREINLAAEDAFMTPTLQKKCEVQHAVYCNPKLIDARKEEDMTQEECVTKFKADVQKQLSKDTEVVTSYRESCVRAQTILNSDWVFYFEKKQEEDEVCILAEPHDRCGP